MSTNMEGPETLFLIKYGEIALKGRNRLFFLRRLKANILRQLESVPGPVPAAVDIRPGRLYLRVNERSADIAERTLAGVFGIVGFSKAARVEKNMAAIRRGALRVARKLMSSGQTFKIEARRTDKSFSPDSYGIACDLGDFLRENLPGLSVNLTRPDWTLYVEIRESAYLYAPETKGPGGLPVGVSGRAMLLLSGGIDSPVAGYLMAKRGLRVDAVYFHTPPFTSNKVREKVARLMDILAAYIPDTALLTVPFTDIQVRIKEQAQPDEVTLLSRASMMRLTGRLARRRKALCLITGESLGQVASQTVQALAFTGSRVSLPVFRPLIGLDKDEIISLARGIGTYETSILPYPDCCTIFAPAHPLTHPNLQEITESYESLDLEPLITAAARATEVKKL